MDRGTEAGHGTGGVPGRTRYCDQGGLGTMGAVLSHYIRNCLRADLVLLYTSSHRPLVETQEGLNE